MRTMTPLSRGSERNMYTSSSYSSVQPKWRGRGELTKRQVSGRWDVEGWDLSKTRNVYRLAQLALISIHSQRAVIRDGNRNELYISIEKSRPTHLPLACHMLHCYMKHKLPSARPCNSRLFGYMSWTLGAALHSGLSISLDDRELR